jgi:uncharacterized surface protein with fasciclin (FAS1) repeats
VSINFYARVLVSDIKAKNGIFHTLKYPLLPPASLLDEYFLFPEEFSILTSSVQRLHASEHYDWSYDRENSKRGHPVFKGTGLATNFAPENKAFAALPEGLKRFLFSPFGGEVLAKILMYHYVPHTLLLSELIHVEKSGHHGHGHGHGDHDHKHDHKKHGYEDIASMLTPDVEFQFGDDPSFHKEFEVPTALKNATLKITVDKKKVLPVEGECGMLADLYTTSTIDANFQALLRSVSRSMTKVSPEPRFFTSWVSMPVLGLRNNNPWL